MSDRPDWDTYYLNGVRWVATRADCRRARHGAILVANNRVVSTGYNGSPRGDQRSCLAGDCPRGTKTRDEVPSHEQGNHDFSDCISLHAEQNAIAYAREPADTIYITGKPCDGCRKLIAAAGIERVVYPGSA